MTDENENTEDWRVRAESAEAALSQMQAQMAARVAQAELKAEAVRAGMIDLDGLKLIDVASIRLNQNGEVEDAASLLVRMKREKPWLFGTAVSSSAAATPPRPEPPRSRHANELSHEEWLNARAALIRRR
ncbi:hypothetical protein [Acidocella aromatica]|uniref:Multidrug efflux pump subunit AcrA (Membrane-fusion protein) n=1 Tax=Acidocella aromatica TaxID=1303579 RepID=A0A840VN80_9PROT|nr:hypothetical protein [Acidocella aromatica]MBB5373629.1 multidrug efflux pump subunit AcrA (membrane-fusion protein) [Acidocella aromatica]